MVIDRCGRVVRRTGIFRPAVLTQSVQLRSRVTFFSRYGNVFAMACVLISAGIVLVPTVRGLIARAGRSRRRKLITGLPFALGIVGASCFPASAGEWTAYTNMKRINAVLPLGTDVWAATAGGAFRFRRSDSTYVVFRTLEGLADNNVLSIAIDEEGTLWFGTEKGGISRYSPSLGRFLPTLTDLVKTRINSLRFLGGQLLVGTQEGISLLEPVPGRPGKWQTKETYDALGALAKGTEVLALTVFSGILYAGTPSGVAQTDLTRSGINLLDPMSWRVTKYPGKVSAFAKADSVLLATTSKGIMRLVGTTGWVYDGILGVQGITADRSGRAYAGKDKSVYQRVDRRWTQVADLSSLVMSMAADSAGTVWIGTAGDGLKRLVNGRQVPMPPLHGPSDNRFTDVVAGGDGTIWAVSNVKDNEITGPVMHFSGKEWQSFTRRDGLPAAPGNPVAVTVDQNGRAWVGTYGAGVAVRDTTGLWTLFDERNSALQASDNREFVVVNRMVTDRSGCIWMSNFTAGLAVFQGFPLPRTQLYTPDQDRLPSGLCTAIAIDENGIKWVGTFNSGFFLFDDGGTPLARGDDRTIFFSTASPDGQIDLTSDKVSDMGVDRTGAVWIATDQGLNVMSGSYSAVSGTYTTSVWRVYGTSNGLPSDVITRLCLDPSGNLWVGTDGGLAQILPDGRVGAVFTHLNSGLMEDDIAALAFRESTGELMIGTKKGLSLLRVGVSAPGKTSAGIAASPNPAGPGARSVRISGLIRGDITKIFTVAGELVRTLPPDSIQGGATVWDRLNESGYYVGSGIYYICVTGETGHTRTARIALVSE